MKVISAQFCIPSDLQDTLVCISKYDSVSIVKFTDIRASFESYYEEKNIVIINRLVKDLKSPNCLCYFYIMYNVGYKNAKI